MSKSQPSRRRKIDYSRSIIKMVVLVLLIAVCLDIVANLLQWKTVDQLPDFLKPYSQTLLFVSPYIRYFDAAIILVLGYFIVGEIGNIVYSYMRGIADHSSAATVQGLARIVGFGGLLGILASVFSLDAAAAITIGGFGGLIIGLATQTFLSNTVAGIFILVTRPFTFGDVITVGGNCGAVKEIKVMHIIIQTIDGLNEVLIPNSLVLNQMIVKKLPGEKTAPLPTLITMDQPPTRVKVGTLMSITGRLIEMGSNKPISNAEITLYDNDIIGDDLLATGTTDENGGYKIGWVSRKVDLLDDTAELFTKFEGDDVHRSCHTKQYVVEVKK